MGLARHAVVAAEGAPVMLAHAGRVDHAMLRKQLVSTADFETAMRQFAVNADVADIQRAILETNGHISIELRDKKSAGATRAANRARR